MKKQNPFSWVPSLYFMQGLPAVIVMQLSVVMYKQLGLSNAHAALISSFLILPWACKVFFAAFVEIHSTKKKWLLVMQACFIPITGLLILSLHQTNFLIPSVIALFCFGLASSFNDIATDGLYLINLETRQQAFFVGIRTLSYQMAILLGKSGILFLVAYLEFTLSHRSAWQIALLCFAGIFFVLLLYHLKFVPQSEGATPSSKKTLSTSLSIFKAFFAIPRITLLIIFILFFEAAQIQLDKIAPLFFMDAIPAGGLALSTKQLALLYGFFGTTAFMLGAFASGLWVWRKNSLAALTPITLLYMAGTLIYVFLSYHLHTTFFITACFYGLMQLIAGLTNGLYMIILLKIANKSPYKTSSYAFATTLMLASMSMFGIISGYLQQILSYRGFFIWIVMLALLMNILALIVKQHGQLHE